MNPNPAANVYAAMASLLITLVLFQSVASLGHPRHDLRWAQRAPAAIIVAGTVSHRQGGL